jgi:hypothetical protein
MANLTLKPTDMGHGPLKDDYAVLDEARTVIGRIFLDTMPAGRPPWFWGNNRVPNWPGKDRDHAMTLEDAKAAFKASWERSSPRQIKTPPHDESVGGGPDH